MRFSHLLLKSTKPAIKTQSALCRTLVLVDPHENKTFYYQARALSGLVLVIMAREMGYCLLLSLTSLPAVEMNYFLLIIKLVSVFAIAELREEL
jgi:hypothetical protein